MGNFYTNITLQGPQRDDILGFLRSNVITAFASPTTERGVTVIYEHDSEEQDVQTLDEISSRLSSHFQCPALAALVHDDDILLLHLHERGSLAFTYDSQAFFHAGVSILCRSFGVPTTFPRVWLTLHLPHLVTIFEHVRHRRVLRYLRLPEWAVASGYSYIERGEFPPGLDREQLRHSRRDT